MTNGSALRPHRGTLILVLGIFGLLCCFIPGVIAWVLGNRDLKDMDAGTVDPSGRGMTQAGKILGIISVVWFAIIIAFNILVMIGALAMPAFLQYKS
jgi:hypothetical protein